MRSWTPALLLLAAVVCANAPTGIKELAEYNHDKEWLANQPNAFIAANIRGDNDQQYRERRMAALDLIREHRDKSVGNELMTELERGSFLGPDICDILAEWNYRRALPTLKKVAADPATPAETKKHALAAIQKIESTPLPPPPPSY